jgi:hypothetical protein
MTEPRFRWRKLGRIFAPDGSQPWMHSHCQNPVPLLMDDRLRVFFNTRQRSGADGMTKSCATFIDLDLADPTRIIALPQGPLLPFGPLGSFDEFGSMAGTVLRISDTEVWIYYVGWSRNLGVPYNHAIGLAVSHDGGTSFERIGDGPVIGRSVNEPYIQNSPFAMKRDGRYHLFYSSGLGWKLHEGKPESIYVLMQASSEDGLHWRRDGRPTVPFVVDDECQTNPSVLEMGGSFHQWFCYRHGLDFRNGTRGYRMGYAWSQDMRHWHRDDAQSVLEPSAQGWDSEMVCYPSVFTMPNGKTYMLYSGNGFGREGFGIAVWDNDPAQSAR